jgi:hypothetical protein
MYFSQFLHNYLCIVSIDLAQRVQACYQLLALHGPNPSLETLDNSVLSGRQAHNDFLMTCFQFRHLFSVFALQPCYFIEVRLRHLTDHSASVVAERLHCFDDVAQIFQENGFPLQQIALVNRQMV